MDRTINELLRDAEELAAEHREEVKRVVNAQGCSCVWQRGNRIRLCQRCRIMFPLFAGQWDKAHKV